MFLAATVIIACVSFLIALFGETFYNGWEDKSSRVFNYFFDLLTIFIVTSLFVCGVLIGLMSGYPHGIWQGFLTLVIMILILSKLFELGEKNSKKPFKKAR